MAESRVLTFGDIADCDILIDAKRGHRWLVSAVGLQRAGAVTQVSYTISSIDEPQKVFNLVNRTSDPVTIERETWPEAPPGPPVGGFGDEPATPPSEADLAKLEADDLMAADPWATTKADHPFQPGFDGQVCEFMAGPAEGKLELCGLSAAYHVDDLLDAAVDAAKALPAEVLVETSTEEVRAADAATDAAPVEVKAFADFDIMAKRSHLFVLHGVHAKDIQTTAQLVAMHDQADADRVNGKLHADYKPHVHAAKES